MIPAGSDTWICYVYLLDFSFRGVACVYFVTMATHTVETTIFAFGCLLKLAFFMKHETLIMMPPNSMFQFHKYSNNKILEDKVSSVKYRFKVNMETCLKLPRNYYYIF